MCNTDGRAALERARAEALIERAVSGVAMLQYTGAPAVLDELRGARVPVVVVSCWDERADCVAVDDAAGAATAVEHLHALGHRRIAHATGRLVEEATREARYAGYERAMTERGLTPRRADADALSERTASSGRRLRGLVGRPDGLTAFTTGNDVMAVRLMDALEDAGLRVPDDVSIVGFDGIELGGWSRIGLTTVAQPRAELVARGLELLVARMDGAAAEPGGRHVRLPAQLVVRSSTAPPSR